MTFTNYAEAHKWIKEGEARMGKMKFRSSAEYHAAQPKIMALYKSEGHKPRTYRTIVRSICLSV